MLPEEDAEEGLCGNLEKSMYGTRDAAQNWEAEYIEFLESEGFETGAANPCVFFHPGVWAFEIHSVLFNGGGPESRPTKNRKC